MLKCSPLVPVMEEMERGRVRMSMMLGDCRQQAETGSTPWAAAMDGQQ